MLAGHASPHIGSRVEARRLALSTRLLLVLDHDLGDLPLDSGKGVESNIRDFVLDAILLQA